MPLSRSPDRGRALEWTSPRILVIGADPLARAGLSALLREAGGRVVGRADPSEIDGALAAHLPDVILVDPGEGAEIRSPVAIVVDAVGALPVMVMVDDPAAARAAGSAGAVGCVPRTASARALLAAAVAVDQGLEVSSPDFRVHPGDDRGSEPAEPLTPRELDVLRHLAEGRSNRGIAAALDISHHTVKAHVDSILGKLGAASRTEAAIRAARMGLIAL